MAESLSATTKPVKTISFLFLLMISYTNAARILEEVSPESPLLPTLPSGQTAAATPVIPPTATDDDGADPQPDEAATPPIIPPVTVAAAAPIPAPTIASTVPSGPASTAATSATVANPVGPQTTPVIPPTATDDEAATPPIIPPVPVAAAAPIPGPAIATNLPTGPASTAATSATVANPVGPQTTPALSFFMHDILGGSHPSVRVVTGLIARTDINGIPFSVPNNNFFPLQGGTPLGNLNNLNNLINPNTAPFISGLNGAQTSTVLQNSGNNNNVVNGNNQPFVTAGQLPAGSALQKLMFGSITVIDDELTEGHELGSAVMGKAQGFYLASSLDGTSHTMALTLLLHEGGESHEVVGDSISLFGVHRSASPESQIAVVGGTGKYENAGGYATVETLDQEDQHITDGVDTIMHISVYLSE